MSEIWFWLLSTLFWIGVMSFYSMQEMACISCNKLRLDYSVAQKKRWAILLHSLLEAPTKLFSTTLIGVNVALMISSESSRRLYQAAGIDPNWAPLVMIPFVLIFGELIPMFAARIYPDHTSRLGAPFLYFSSKLLSPFTAIVEFFFQHASVLVGTSERKESPAFLSRDELQKLLEEHHEGYFGEQEAPAGAIMSNIFSLRNKRAFQFMQRLEQFPCVSSHATVSDVRQLASKMELECLLVYHRHKQKIVGIAYLTDLLAASDSKKVREYAKSPCFVTQETQALELLFRLLDEEVQDAVVLNDKGEAIGIILLEDLLDELFGPEPRHASVESHRLLYLEKTIPADMKITDFNETYGTGIDPQGCATFAELVEKLLGRHPTLNDTVLIDPLELLVKETSLFKAKTIQVRTSAP